MSQKFKLIEGYSPQELETRVNYFLDENPDYRVHGSFQMLGHSQYVQTLTETKAND